MSMMSAPSATICSACATAASDDRKAPPSENESGVTFKIPMTSGRRSASRLARASAFAAGGVPDALETGGDTAIMARMCAVTPAMSSEAAPALQRLLQRSDADSIRNLHRKFLGVVDPALDRVLGRQYAHELAFHVRLRHRPREP